ncbi:unnamed protein product [Cylindrotheca closterium]|uniref:Uncharacterized protein n=1 Tax=Cylindrotheca closterium TaxID=2856 RepID=A0AAD2FPJ4_9STRA|nr:unnamed protein product [Cylindrotheca closterium]
MVVRMAKDAKTNNGSGIVKYFAVILLLVGSSLVPTMLNTKSMYRDLHAMVYAETPSSKQVSSSQSRISGRNFTDGLLDNDNNDVITRTTPKSNGLQEPHDNPRTDSSIPVPHFEKQEGVAIVTQIHGPHQYKLLRQSFCLLHKAYNSRLLYDYIVFLAEPLAQEDIDEVTKLVYPAKLTFVSNAPNGFHALLEELEPARRDSLLKRCKDPDMYNLNWGSECPGRLAYSWQAEFRSLRVWRQPALADYKYMFWIDSDMFATGVWKQDPVAYMVAHDLVVLFAHHGGGRARPQEVDKTHEVYGKSFCDLSLTKDGFFHSVMSKACHERYAAIHGFFHITNLDFYRTDEVHQWLTTFRHDCFLCREYDDQVAVTVPAAVLAPNRSKDMRKSGLILNNYHNSMIDGQIKSVPAGFKMYWRKIGAFNFTEADGFCPITEAS